MVVVTAADRRLGRRLMRNSDVMLISISDLVSCEVSGTEAVAADAEGLSGDLNAEDLETSDVTS